MSETSVLFLPSDLWALTFFYCDVFGWFSFFELAAWE